VAAMAIFQEKIDCLEQIKYLMTTEDILFSSQTFVLYTSEGILNAFLAENKLKQLCLH